MIEAIIVSVFVVGAAVYSASKLLGTARGKTECRCAAKPDGCSSKKKRTSDQLPILLLLTSLVSIPAMSLDLDGRESLDGVDDELSFIASDTESQPRWWEKERLTADLGLHETLAQIGMLIELQAKNESFSKQRGGLNDDAFRAVDSLVDLSLTFDLETIGLSRTTFFINAQNGTGQGVSDEHLGDLMVVSNIDARDYHQLSEYHLNYHTKGERFSIKFGKQDANADFAAVDHCGSFGMAALSGSARGPYCRLRLRVPQVENPSGPGTLPPSLRNLVRSAGYPL